MKYIKKLSTIFFFTLLFFLVFEFFSRTIIFFITKNKIIFEYGFNKTILFKVKDLSKLDFILFSEKKEKIKNKKKLLNPSKEKLIIWAFGGSTTEGHEDGCGQATSNWVSELSKLNENILTVNFGKGRSSTINALNTLHEQAVANEFLENTKHESSFNVPNQKLKYFYLYDFNKGKPDIILWAHKYNEQTNYTHLNKNFFKKNSKKFLQRLDYTFKLNFVSYFLFNDFIEKLNYKIFGYKQKKDKFQVGNKYKISKENLKKSKIIYKNNTIKAAKFAKNFDIDFHIISLFGKYYGSSDSFYHIPFYDYWLKAAEEISKKYNLYFFKTEDEVLETVRKNYREKSSEKKTFFCDHIHQNYLGNVLTAEIINDYLIKTYDLE